MKIMFFIYGIPGSGKTTLGNRLAEKFKISYPCEADSFFVDPKTGEYNFRKDELSKAHYQCRSKVVSLLRDKLPVIVSNTSLRDWERKQYHELARKYNYAVVNICCDNEFGNIHGVPDKKLEEMKSYFVPMTGKEMEDIGTKNIHFFYTAPGFEKLCEDITTWIIGN